MEGVLGGITTYFLPFLLRITFPITTQIMTIMTQPNTCPMRYDPVFGECIAIKNMKPANIEKISAITTFNVALNNSFSDGRVATIIARATPRRSANPLISGPV